MKKELITIERVRKFLKNWQKAGCWKIEPPYLAQEIVKLLDQATVEPEHFDCWHEEYCKEIPKEECYHTNTQVVNSQWSCNGCGAGKPTQEAKEEELGDFEKDILGEHGYKLYKELRKRQKEHCEHSEPKKPTLQHREWCSIQYGLCNCVIKDLEQSKK